jgi:hypothetical protein
MKYPTTHYAVTHIDNHTHEKHVLFMVSAFAKRLTHALTRPILIKKMATPRLHHYEKWSDAKLSGPVSLWEKTN